MDVFHLIEGVAFIAATGVAAHMARKASVIKGQYKSQCMLLAKSRSQVKDLMAAKPRVVAAKPKVVAAKPMVVAAPELIGPSEREEELAGQLESLKRSHSDIAEMYRKASESVEKIAGTLAKRDEEIRSLHSRAIAAGDESAERERSMMDSVSSISSELSKSQSEFASLAASVIPMERELAELREYRKLQTGIAARVTADRNESAKKIRNLENEIKSLRAEGDSRRQEVVSLESRLARATKKADEGSMTQSIAIGHKVDGDAWKAKAEAGEKELKTVNEELQKTITALNHAKVVLKRQA